MDTPNSNIPGRELVVTFTQEQADKFWAKSKVVRDCWEWQAVITWDGYGRQHAAGAVQYAHRVAYVLHYGRIPKGMKILHRCDNPSCIRPSHLFMGTQKDNMHDMESKGRARGRFKSGQKPHNRNFSDEQVRSIRKRLREGVPKLTIARELGVSDGCIWFIDKGKSYKDVPD